MVLRTKKDGKGYYIGCRSYPECKRAVWFPSGVLEASLTNETCQQV
jgi:DNA topoisomerase III